MSWDIFVQDLPRDAKSVAEIPADFRPAPLGKRLAIIEKIKGVVPSTDFSDPSWGRIDGDGWSIEVDCGSEEDCRGFVLHVRDADFAAVVVSEILEHLEVRAIDSQTGDFFVRSEAIESLRRWRGYRNHVTDGNEG
ncbi:MAG TPA: hypothetical protein VKS44_06185 [Candidatus Acidoferrales bacterium]|nr:hypothetical protein [Candidatus Acidoferrales bacterium]